MAFRRHQNKRQTGSVRENACHIVAANSFTLHPRVDVMLHGLQERSRHRSWQSLWYMQAIERGGSANSTAPFLSAGLTLECRRMISSLTSRRIADLSRNAQTGIAIEVVDETASTNADLLARLPELSGPTLLVAKRQTAGRGRAGRSWISSEGGSLTFSLAWRFERPLHRLTGLPLAVGVAIVDALQRFGVAGRLKWPNDVLNGGRKLAGILIESTASRPDVGTWMVIGIGVNIDLPDDCLARIDQPPGMLPGLAQQEHAVMIAALLDELADTLPRFDADGFPPFMDRWNALHAHAQREVQLIDNGQIRHTGTATGVDAQGRFLIETAAGTLPVMAGDISLRVNDEQVRGSAA